MSRFQVALSRLGVDHKSGGDAVGVHAGPHILALHLRVQAPGLGERRDEGGMRSVPRKDNTSMCFTETADGKYRLRPLFYVSDADKKWYKDYYKIRYSDAYEVYGLTRTGCCGCSISAKAIEDLEKIRPFEPNLVKAAWNVFGDSYRYRQKYNAYKKRRQLEEKGLNIQMSILDFLQTQHEGRCQDVSHR